MVAREKRLFFAIAAAFRPDSLKVGCEIWAHNRADGLGRVLFRSALHLASPAHISGAASAQNSSARALKAPTVCSTIGCFARRESA
jgi:hypothetical protein